MKRICLVTLSLFAVASLLWVAGCAAPGATTAPAAPAPTTAPAGPAATSAPAATQAPATGPNSTAEKAKPLENVPCAVPGQMILFGRRGALSDLKSRYGLTGETEFAMTGFEMLRETQKTPVLDDYPPSDYSQLAMWVVPTGDPFGLAQSINGDSRSKPSRDRVAAGRNFVLQHPGIAASSWHADGSPNGPPWLLPADVNSFLNQWAFQHVHAIPQPEKGGEGVWVGIFDAFPESIGVQPIATDLAVIEPQNPGAVDISAHGMFVASEIRYLAPNAKQLYYRVLDRYGRGTVPALIVALDDFMTQIGRDAGRAGAVINLSLGIPVGCVDPYDAELSALQQTLKAAYRSNAAIVAASGNARTAPDIPARWADLVLATGASNIDDKMSCFSNGASVLAPGGEGTPAGCEPDYSACPDQANQCRTALVGEVPADVSKTGYAYWSGTSFAAPLVTGIAAQLMSEHQGLIQEMLKNASSIMTPSIQRAITCSDAWMSASSPSVVTLDSARGCWAARGMVLRSLTNADGYKFTLPGGALPAGATITNVTVQAPGSVKVYHRASDGEMGELVTGGQSSSAFNKLSPEGDWEAYPESGDTSQAVLIEVGWAQ